MTPKTITTSIYDKRLEIHYNEWYIRNKEGKVRKLELQGKIKCPLLNAQVSSIVCSKLMDKLGWPRAIDEAACEKCFCWINLSISKFQKKKSKDYEENTNERKPGKQEGPRK